MKKVSNKLRVNHYPQIPCEPFFVDVKDEEQAHLIIETLADQHLFLYDNNFIPDYSNILMVVMWEENEDENGNGAWVDYYNEEEMMEWDEVVTTYLTDAVQTTENPETTNNHLLELYTQKLELSRKFLETTTNSGSVNDVKKIARINERIDLYAIFISHLKHGIPFKEKSE